MATDAEKEKETLLAKGADSAKDAAKDEGSKLMKWVKEGPMALKVLSFLGGLGVMTVSFTFFFNGLATLKLTDALTHFYTFIFGLLTVVLEMNNFFCTAGFRATIESEFRFLSRLWGRGVFYFFVGTLLFSLMNTLQLIVSVYMMGIGIISIAVSRNTAKKLERLKDATGHIQDRDQIRAIFNKYDHDRSGYIQKDELKNLAVDLNITLTDNELRAAMDVLDPNRRGEISFENFYLWWIGKSNSYV